MYPNSPCDKIDINKQSCSEWSALATEQHQKKKKKEKQIVLIEWVKIQKMRTFDKTFKNSVHSNECVLFIETTQMAVTVNGIY